MAAQWFCRLEGQEVGPVTFQDMVGYIQRGQLKDDDRVRRENSDKWVAVRDVVGLLWMARKQSASTADESAASSEDDSGAPSDEAAVTPGGNAAPDRLETSPTNSPTDAPRGPVDAGFPVESSAAAASLPGEPGDADASVARKRPFRTRVAIGLGAVTCVGAVLLLWQRGLFPFGGGYREPSPAVAAIEREVADWVLRQGGRVSIRMRGTSRLMEPANTLPQARFYVEQVHLRDNRSIGDDVLENAARLAELHELRVCGTSVSNAGLKHLKGAKFLETLDLCYTAVTDDGLEHLSGLINLKTLLLSGNAISDPGLNHLSGLTQLEQLDLYRTFVSDETLSKLSAFSRLEGLNVRRTRVTVKGALALKQSLPRCALGVDSEISMALGRGVSIASADPDRRAAHWAIECGGKVELSVDHKHTSATKLEELPSEKFQLTDIHLGGKVAVDDLGLESLRGLGNLRSLHMWSAQISDKGLEPLKDLTSLETMNLAYTPITDSGLQSLEKLTNLRYLCLNYVGISDKGLANLQGCQALRILPLAGTRVTDKGLQQLQGFRNLRELDLTGTKVTAAGATAFRKACKRCTVRHP